MDSNDPLGYCFGDMASFEAGILFIFLFLSMVFLFLFFPHIFFS